MECWCVSKMKYSLLMMMMIIGSVMVSGIEGGCIQEERNALLQIKTSLIDLYGLDVDHFLPSWVDDGRECCDWERVMCNTTIGHVTDLSLRNVMGIPDYQYYDTCRRINWPLNVSVFLHFEELTSLNLSMNCLDDGIVNTGLGRLSSLKKLEILDLSENRITNNTLPSLGALTLLRVLNLSYYDGLCCGYFPALGMSLENLEILDLSGNYLEGFEQVSLLKKLKVLNLRFNFFNESFITSLSALPMLKSLDLSENYRLGRSFLAKELVHLTNLEELDLSGNDFNDTPSIQECTRLSRLIKLKSISLKYNKFNKSIISCLGALPSLKTLDLSFNKLGGSFPIQGLGRLSSLKKLQTLDLSWNDITNVTFPSLGALTSLRVLNLHDNHLEGYFPALALENLEILDLSRNEMEGFEQVSLLKKLKVLNLMFNDFNESSITSLSALPMLKSLDLSGNWHHLSGTSFPVEAFTSFHHLEVLDLSYNSFVGSIPSTIQQLSSLRAVSFAYNNLNGSLLGLCELKNLQELELSHNIFNGSVPQCFNSLSSLKLLDISSNQFTGTLPPSLIANLTSLEYVNFSDNQFEGIFSLSSFSGHTKLEVVRFICNSDKFEVETEEPMGWIPMFQLKAFVLSGCINRFKESVVPGFLLHQRTLQVIDLSHNSLEGQFPKQLIENNTMLKALVLRNNSFICMPMHTHANLAWLDMSENDMIGTIPVDIQKFFPYLQNLNLSRNSLDGSIPSSVGDLSRLSELDLSDNKLSGEVPKGLFSNISLQILKLSNNLLHGMVLSGNSSFNHIGWLALDNNCFTGKIGNGTSKEPFMDIMDISNNFFTGTIPHWISNMSGEFEFEFVARNNSLEGQFPCGKTPFSFLDISQNSFSGPIPSCLNFQEINHLHLGSNKFTGSIPDAFRNLTSVLTLDIGNNSLSGRIPEFLGNLSDLRILILRQNNFTGTIPKQLCQLNNVSFIDLSSNFVSGSIPRCLRNIKSPANRVFIERIVIRYIMPSEYYQNVLSRDTTPSFLSDVLEIQDEVQFTIKTHARSYKGHLLDLMVGLDLSCNKLVGEIPKELGLLTQIHSLNLSHNQLTGTIPMQFSNLENIESLDLSYNGLSGKVPTELIKLNFLALFNVSYNKLSGRLPDMKAQFNTFTKESYEGNPLLCGPPLVKKCTATSSPQVTSPSSKEEDDNWYDDIDFLASFFGTWVVFMLGFAGVLYVNPYWRRRWLEFVEESMYTCYYFLEDSVRKVSRVFRK